MLVRSNGYNRWPDHFPPSIPCSIRWPQLMSSVAAWPYQWLVTRGPTLPEWTGSSARRMVATFVHPISPVWRWVIVPSPLALFSHVEYQVIVHNEGGELSGVTRRLKVVTQAGQEMEGESKYTNLRWPEDENYQWQNEAMWFTIQAVDGHLLDYATFRINIAPPCGTEINVG